MLKDKNIQDKNLNKEIEIRAHILFNLLSS